MEFDTNFWKVVKYLFENPYDEIHLRELSRKTNVSVYTVKNIIDQLSLEEIIEEKKVGNMRFIKANMNNTFFKHLKIAFSIKKILDSKIIEFVKENIPAVSSIILYGSTAKGGDDTNSDLDLLVIGQSKKIDVSGFENKLKRQINLLAFKWSEWREHANKDKAFYKEIITDGIALYGNLPVVE